MNARPNLLNQLEVVPNLMPNQHLYFSGHISHLNNLYGFGRDASSEEYVMYGGLVPKDAVPGSTLTLKLLTWPKIANTTGADKVVKIGAKVNSVGLSGVIGAVTDLGFFLETVPDQEAAGTIHIVALGTLANVQPNDYVTFDIRRIAADSADTYGYDFVFAGSVIIEYESYLLKKS